MKKLTSLASLLILTATPALAQTPATSTQSQTMPDGKGGAITSDTTATSNANGTTVTKTDTHTRVDPSGTKHESQVKATSAVNNAGEPTQTNTEIKTETTTPDGKKTSTTDKMSQ